MTFAVVFISKIFKSLYMGFMVRQFKKEEKGKTFQCKYYKRYDNLPYCPGKEQHKKYILRCNISCGHNFGKISSNKLRHTYLLTAFLNSPVGEEVSMMAEQCILPQQRSTNQARLKKHHNARVLQVMH